MGKRILLLKYMWKDYKHARALKKQGIIPFSDFGLTLFTGRQGAGKTMSMVHEAEQLRLKYPNLYICSNFGYVHENESLKSLTDITNAVLRANEVGACGTLILWDEIQNDFDSFSKVSRDVLRVVTQQRKQGIKILGTSQVFTRVSKALREQTFNVVMCRTIFKRWTVSRFYDADEYNHNIDRPEEKRKMFPLRKVSFVQTDELRELYDSYAVIRTLQEQAKEEKKNTNVYVMN
ncbi:ATPase [Enterococcus lemanii]|uniref:ATPase n=1 Tax=Enterococcus lemanii TaxID=1159752 RepID=A0ABV9MXM4_9ENTE|nr:ATPase [Enterococcus lemanii]MBM7709602.1 ATP-dependent Clp protease ATP-binding subunit ClpX [Enterococcus lemanii]